MEGREEDTSKHVFLVVGGFLRFTFGGRRWNLLVGVVCSWRFSWPVGQILLGAGSSFDWAVCPLVLGLISDVTNLSPGWISIQVEEANSPCIDGHHHYHQANDIDSQASFHHIFDLAVPIAEDDGVGGIAHRQHHCKGDAHGDWDQGVEWINVQRFGQAAQDGQEDGDGGWVAHKLCDNGHENACQQGDSPWWEAAQGQHLVPNPCGKA